MASDFVKRIYSALKIEDLDRSVYNACSAAVLHLMIKTWVPVSLVTLWNINTTPYSKIWLFMAAIHVLGWVVIYSGCLMMDMSELVGLKQVWYKISCRPCPMSMKSRELRRFYGHMRHPSFTGFLMILWIHPIMRYVEFTLKNFHIVSEIFNQQDKEEHAISKVQDFFNT